jgi:uroporphyrinogen decarboxylase
MEMTSRERVAAALRREEPDRLPWCELAVDRYLSEQLMHWGGPEDQTFNLEAQQYTLDQAKAVASFLNHDNIVFVLRAPVYAHKAEGIDGRLIMPTMLSMGMEPFSLALYDNRGLVQDILDIYYDWVCVVAERACQMDFDVFVSTDDMAFKTNTFFSPKVFREMILPRYQQIAEKITLPWIIHSDGNVRPFMDDLLSLKIAGFHPVEKGAMDIGAMKRDYGNRLCLLGNVDLVTLGRGTPGEVDEEVRGLIQDIAPGGGYIISSGNSLAGYLLPENVLAMRDAIQRYGSYPIDI